MSGQSAMYKKLNMAFRLHKITAADVWSHVPDDITAEEATQICGPRPYED